MKIQAPSILITMTLLCSGLVPKAHAVNPPPDGGYPGGNTAEGQSALGSLTSGLYNTAVGIYSLLSLTDGNFCTGVGAGTLLANTANSNTAIGAGTLLSNTTGEANTANGAFALFSNTGGSFNTAVGDQALQFNTTGFQNTATGVQALFSNTEGTFNTANGIQALFSNVGSGNTAVGFQALFNNTNNDDNTAVGRTALFNNTTGNGNTAIGRAALAQNISGASNVALGNLAGGGVFTASNVIAIGAPGADVSDSCFIGNIYTNVQPIVGTDPDSVTITSTGRLGRGNVSSRRYKHDIKPMEKASEALYALKPVSFRYHKEYDASQTLAFGLIAEEVAEVYPDLVGRNPKGQPESVRYEQINAMLLNEFLKEHRKNKEQEATIAELKSTLEKQQATITEQQTGMQALAARLNEQAAQIQKVNAQVELSKFATGRIRRGGPAAQMVGNQR